MANKLAALVGRLRFGQSLIISSEGKVFVESDGVRLSVQGTNRYFKKTKNDEGNEGAEFFSFLKSQGLDDLSTVVDLGANFGEISLWFAKTFPSARIVAVEPAPENLRILNENIEAQVFNISKIEVAPYAMLDRMGTVKISSGLGSENSVVSDQKNQPMMFESGFSEVPATTLTRLFADFEIEHVDFMKVDIEGAEPLLRGDLVTLAPRIKSMLIEFSSKNDTDSYLSLLDSLVNAGYSCHLRGETRSVPVESVWAEYLEKRKTGGGVDIWFVR